MLTSRIAASYADGVARLAAHSGTEVIARTGGAEPDGAETDRAGWGCAALVGTAADDFLADRNLHDEVFGAVSVIVRAADRDQLLDVARALEGQLTATVHAAEADTPLAAELLPVLERKAGRILFNGWPTGVEVVPAMVHGGPYPATSDSRTTSVGTLAMDRFLRPVAYQDVPDALLPSAVRESNPDGLLRHGRRRLHQGLTGSRSAGAQHRRSRRACNSKQRPVQCRILRSLLGNGRWFPPPRPLDAGGGRTGIRPAGSQRRRACGAGRRRSGRRCPCPSAARGTPSRLRR